MSGNGFGNITFGPQNMTMDYFKSKNLKAIPSRGPLSVTVPGCVGGWFQLHDKFGKLPISDILLPAVNYAREGVPVHRKLRIMNGSFIPSKKKT